jgi:cysteate synthase
MADAWEKGSREISIPDDETARRQVAEIMATVLSNRKPPYGIAGGLFDAMQDAGGEFLTVTNNELMEASALFESTEGIDIHPAAAVAVASLKKSAEEGRIGRSEPVMINITGGGEALMKKGRELYTLRPSVVFGTTPSQEEVTASLATLFRGT